jgi:DNA-binding NtrC family response regulator
MPKKISILIADDNDQFCHNVADILEVEGYEVALAYDGRKAVEMVKHNGFALALLDVKMPVMNGVETFKKIKRISPHIPVIMVTAYTVENLLREALRGGAYGSLKKPLDFEQLFRIISQATSKEPSILVVDDDKDICANLKEILSDSGYQVCTACDGKAAIEQARTNNFDIIILDMKLPVLNGLETYLSIRDFRPNLTSIMITGYPQKMNKVIHKAQEEHVYACLEKPLNMDELILLLNQIQDEKTNGTLKKPE